MQKEMATHSSVLAWRIPRMGEPGGLPSVGSHRVGHDWDDLAAAAAACMHAQLLRGVWIFVTLWTVVCQAPLSTGFSREELEWVAISSFMGSSQPRATCGIRTAGRFFTIDLLGKPYSWILFTYQHLSLSLSLSFIHPSISTERHIFSIQSSEHGCFLTIGHQFHHQHWVSRVGAADFNSTVPHTFRRYNTGHLLWAGGGFRKVGSVSGVKQVRSTTIGHRDEFPCMEIRDSTLNSALWTCSLFAQNTTS